MNTKTNNVDNLDMMMNITSVAVGIMYFMVGLTRKKWYKRNAEVIMIMIHCNFDLDKKCQLIYFLSLYK